ncbi:MAG: hypothetical protein VZR11_13900 [Succinimonas sp.]|nr:hypothetical protein [Succinimonas sp.]
MALIHQDECEGSSYAKLGLILAKIPNIIERDRDCHAGHSISEILAEMKRDAVNSIAADFAGKRLSTERLFWMRQRTT